MSTPPARGSTCSRTADTGWSCAKPVEDLARAPSASAAGPHAGKHPGLVEGKHQLSDPALVGFHALLTGEAAGIMTDKGSFLGHGGSSAAPRALVRGEFPAPTGRWDDPIASIATEIALAPGET